MSLENQFFNALDRYRDEHNERLDEIKELFKLQEIKAELGTIKDIVTRMDARSSSDSIKLALLLTIATNIQDIIVAKFKPVKITITFSIGGKIVAGQMTDVQTIDATIEEDDAAGSPVSFDPANITWTVGDSTIVALTQNSDGSASFKALKVGTTSVGVSDKVTGLSAQDTLTVTADVATSLKIAFGTPHA